MQPPQPCTRTTHTRAPARLPSLPQVRRLDERLRKADHDAQLFNAREGLLGLPISDYSHVRNLMDQFDPFLQFWTTSATWRVGGGQAGRGRATGGVRAAPHRRARGGPRRGLC